MGTRGLTIVKLGGKVKIAQYGQWDHYPTGQGATISKFIREKMDLHKLKAKVKALEFTTDEEIEQLYQNNTENFKEKYPQFHRDTGAEILELVQSGKVPKVLNSIDFLKDSLFCEYAYELDLDKKVVKVYTGSNKLDNGEYGECKVYKTYKFSEFAEPDAMKKLEQELQREE
jgi:hypothetical protein